MRGLVAQHGQSERLLSVRSRVRIPPGPLQLLSRVLSLDDDFAVWRGSCEFPSDNIERAKKFYNSLFDWKIEKMPDPIEYWMFATIIDKGEQTIGGRVMKRQQAQQPIINDIDVNSMGDYAKKVEKFGGEVKVPKTEVPGFGLFAMCTDTENNTFGLSESKEGAH